MATASLKCWIKLLYCSLRWALWPMGLWLKIFTVFSLNCFRRSIISLWCRELVFHRWRVWHQTTSSYWNTVRRKAKKLLTSKFIHEPPHDKTNNVAVRPAKTQISLGIRPVWSESSLSAWRKLGSLATQLSAQRRFWSDWADAQADLSLLWVHKSFCWFCHELAHVWILSDLQGGSLKWALKRLLKHTCTTFYQNLKISLIWINNFSIYSIHFW